LQLPPSDCRAPYASRQAESDDLAGSVYTGISAPGETDSNPLTGQSVKGLLQHSLNGPRVGLDLGASEGRPVVFEHRPSASRRSGGHASPRP
jgi:hypothetical protein